MVTDTQFEILAKKYKTSSWAIWSDEFLKADCHNCVENVEGKLKEYFMNRLKLLKNNIILLGLNPSGDDPSRVLGNFHTVKANGKPHPGDHLLGENIMRNNQNIQGAYMTDISDVIEGNQKNVTLDNNIVKEQLDDKINILGSENIHIVCFGDKVFDKIYDIYGNGIEKVKNEYDFEEFSIKWKSIKFYHIYHYSYIARWNKVADKEKFKKQLEYVNKAVQKNA